MGTHTHTYVLNQAPTSTNWSIACTLTNLSYFYYSRAHHRYESETESEYVYEPYYNRQNR